MELDVLLGQDLSAYGWITISIEEDNPTKEEIVKEIRAFIESADFEEAEFEADWTSLCAMRIVLVRNGEDTILENVSLEPSPYDGAQGFMRWLSGETTLKSAIDEAAEAAWFEQETSVVDVYRGKLTLPSGEIVEAEFECRNGATHEEKNLAFLEALTKVVDIEYTAIGERAVVHDHKTHPKA